jgi:hypothetical protein
MDYGNNPYAIAIHTSDRLSFKTCRRRWDILSDNRQGRKPIEAPRPLEFGSAFHAGMATFYNPYTWAKTDEAREIMVVAAINAFKTTMRDMKARYLYLTGNEALSDEQQVEYLEDLDLGEGMFWHYFDYVKRHNMDRFTPAAVELSFEVDIFTSDEIVLYFSDLMARALEQGYTGLRIVYRGRIDCLMQDEWGQYWIIDWKTTARMRDDLEYLEMDEQLGSYNWALEHMLGIKVEGNQNNPTSYDMALKQLTEEGEDLSLYEDYLNFLKAEGIVYVRRTKIHRNAHQHHEIGERIKMEVREQLNPNLLIYPSPGPWKCNGCPVRPVCVGMNDGSDVQWILNQYTTLEMRTNA